MKTSRTQIGTKVNGKKGTGTITKIITKSTGYVEVTYEDGSVKKEMSFNLTDEDGISLKSTPKKSTYKKSDRRIQEWEDEKRELRRLERDCF